MEKLKEIARPPLIAILIFFIAHFLYYVFLGRYSLIYQEQIQLFLFDLSFLSDFIARPGGLTDYIGMFLIQFYRIPVLGALIVSMTGFVVYYLSSYIFRKFNITSVIAGLIPVVALFILQTDPYFTISWTVALSCSLAIAVVYINLKNIYIRYFSALVLWIFIYAAAGGFSFLALALFVIYELYTSKNFSRFPVTCLWLLAAAVIPYLLWLTVYQIPLPEAWLSQNLHPINIQTMKGGLALLVYYPLAIIAFGILYGGSKKPALRPGWNWSTALVLLVACLFIYGTLPGLKRVINNHHRIATIMKLDYCIQHRTWERGMKISSKYKRTDPLAVFYTNICLLKTGKLSNNMFNYRQVGRNGLILDWVEDNVTPFFGSEIFYQLGYVNEAYRWSYEALIATGQGPRMLKRLIITSILNDDFKVAEKYIDVLARSLFYHKWAETYRDYIYKPDKDRLPVDLAKSARLNVQKDFFYDLDNYKSDVENMMENNPGNKEIFEYSLALHMLEKDLVSLVSDGRRLGEFGYKEIPVHLEEAILVYMVNTNVNAVPDGFSIRESTMQRFRYYLNMNTTYVARPRAEAAKVLSKDYGDTYWYYSQFF